MATIATAVVQLIPTFRGGAADIAKQLGGTEVGKIAGTEIGAGITSSLTTTGAKVGEEFSAKFAESARVGGQEGGSAAGSAFSSRFGESLTGVREELATTMRTSGRTAGEEGGAAAGEGFGGKFRDSIKEIAGPLIALFALSKVADFFKESLGAGEQAAKTSALIATEIKNTGGAAGVSMDKVEELAKSVGSTAGVAREQIMEAEQALLKFANVKDVAGAGNDIFSRSTKDASDLAAVMHTTVPAAAALLGKALNDPATGLTKLTRAGLTFTTQQKDQIKSMEKSGNVLGAQKIILAQFEKQFGGAAANSATAGDKFRASMENLKDSVGTALLPILNKMMGVLVAIVTPLVNLISSSTGTATAIKSVAAVVGVLVAAFAAYQVGVLVAGAVTKAYTAVQEALTVVMDANPIMLVVVAIAALAVGFIYAYKHSATFRDIVKQVMADVKKAVDVFWADAKLVFAALVTFVTKTIPGAFTTMRNYIVKIWTAVRNDMTAWWNLEVAGWKAIGAFFKNVALKIWSDLRAAVVKVWTTIRNDFTAWWNLEVTGWKIIASYFKGAVMAIWNTFRNAVKNVWNTVKTDFTNWWNNEVALFKTIAGYVKGAATATWTAFRNAIKAVWNGIESDASGVWTGRIVPFFAGIKNYIVGNATAVWVSFRGAVNNVWNGIHNDITGIWTNKFLPFFNTIKTWFTSTIPGYFSTGATDIGKAWTAIESVVAAPIDWIRDNVINPVLVTGFDAISKVLGGPQIPKMAAGGPVSGPGGPTDDLVNARLSNGEFVVNAKSTADHLSLLHAINNGSGGGRMGPDGIAGFSLGGIWHGITGIVKGVWDAISDPGKLITDAYNKVIGGIPGAGATVTEAKDAGAALVKAAVSKIESLFSAAGSGGSGGGGSGGGPVGSGVARWVPTIQQAMGMLGWGPNLLGAVEAQMTTESGGNPTVVNKWDSNWQAGHPSVGLMQVIAGTFAEYAGQYRNTGPFEYGVSTNGLANIYAGLNYAMHAYPNDPTYGVGHGHGYDSGGLWPSGTAGANASGSPERVLSPIQTQWFENSMRAAAHKSGSVGATHVVNNRVFIGTREITDIVRTEIDESDNATAQYLAYHPTAVR